jgi:hypothetical protein
MTRKQKRQKFNKPGPHLQWSIVCEAAKHGSHAFLQQCTVGHSSAWTASMDRRSAAFCEHGQSCPALFPAVRTGIVSTLLMHLWICLVSMYSWITFKSVYRLLNGSRETKDFASRWKHVA